MEEPATAATVTAGTVMAMEGTVTAMAGTTTAMAGTATVTVATGRVLQAAAQSARAARATKAAQVMAEAARAAWAAGEAAKSAAEAAEAAWLVTKAVSSQPAGGRPATGSGGNHKRIVRLGSSSHVTCTYFIVKATQCVDCRQAHDPLYAV